MVIKNLPALQLRDSNPHTIWYVIKDGQHSVWLNDRGNDREAVQTGGWDEETERGRDTKSSLGW